MMTKPYFGYSNDEKALGISGDLDVDFKQFLFGFLKKNPMLSSVRFRGRDPADIQAFAEAITTIPSITELNLSPNTVQPDTIRTLTKNPHLKTLDLEGPIDLETAEAFAQNTTLHTLNIELSEISEDAIKALEKNTGLQSINIRCRKLDDNKIKALAHLGNLASLSLTDCNITPEAAKLLAANKNLKRLDLNRCKVEEDTAKALAASTSLESLALFDCNLQDAEAEAIAKSTSLKSLNVYFNKIGRKGAKALSENPTLTSLNIGHNPIRYEGISALAKNTTLVSLSLAGSEMLDMGAELLADNKTLRSLDLSGNKISDRGARALATHPSLTELHLRSNNIHCSGAKKLAENEHLITLNLTQNAIEDEGIEAFDTNKTLESLRLNNNVTTDKAESLIKDRTGSFIDGYGRINTPKDIELSPIKERLRLFKDKIEQFWQRQNNQNAPADTHYYEVIGSMILVQSKFESLISDYENNAKIDSDAFKKQVREMLLDDSMKDHLAIIDKHRGSKQLLVDVIAAIFTLGISLIYTAATKGQSFFKVSTDTRTLLDIIVQSVDEIPAPGKTM